MALLFEDAEHAVSLMKRLREKLSGASEKSLRNAMDRLVGALESDLFNSLIDIQKYYRQMLEGKNLESHRDVCTSPNERDFSRKSGYAHLESPNPQEPLSLIESSEWEYIEVVISRPAGENHSFGFSIAGGYDAPQANGDPSIYVTRLAPGGLAEADKRLRPFDQIISVNGADLTSMSNQEAVQILRESGDTLAMIIRRFIGVYSEGDQFPLIVPESGSPIMPMRGSEIAVNEIYYEVNLVKRSPTIGLGFSIAGGQMSECGPDGIYVTRISPGGLAEQSQQIQPGDRLIQVNGQELGNATHEEAVDLLRNAGAHVHLVLSRAQETSHHSLDNGK